MILRVSASPRLLIALTCALMAVASPAAQSDLDALMERILARRDDNWTKLQQYVLEERETLAITGPDNRKLFGAVREYLWFPRDGRFIKSPLTADGVTISEDERRRQEVLWLRREEDRERRRAGRGTASDQERRAEVSIGPGGVRVRKVPPGSPDDATVEAVVRDTLEPGFVSAAYFLNFKFEPGRFALVGRETFAGRDVLHVEYYPATMFKEGRTRPNRELRERDQDVERKMNKVAQVSLWVLPEERQIVKYEFANIDMDFLPGSWLIRPDGWQAWMEMSQPFPNVWLPRAMGVAFDVKLAIGPVAGRYSTEYHDYRLATVETNLRR